MAQLDRASPSEGGDCAFESRRVRQELNRRLPAVLFLLCNLRFERACVRQRVGKPSDSAGEPSRMPRRYGGFFKSDGASKSVRVRQKLNRRLPAVLFLLCNLRFERACVRQRVGKPSDSAGEPSRMPRRYGGFFKSDGASKSVRVRQKLNRRLPAVLFLLCNLRFERACVLGCASYII